VFRELSNQIWRITTNVTFTPIQASDGDAVLMTRMGSGDRDAFAELFRLHQATVFRFARQMSGSRDVAEDITQDVFVALLRQADRFDPRRASLATYLYGISRNLVLRRLRRRSRRVTLDLDDVDRGRTPALVVERDPPTDIDRASDLARLRRRILALPLRHREVIVLCELHELTYEEAARIVRCPVGTIRSRLSRARRTLLEQCHADAQHTAVAEHERAGRRCLA
jgi:RNA polymerase sigma-70 factor (ECF subfamily)